MVIKQSKGKLVRIKIRQSVFCGCNSGLILSRTEGVMVSFTFMCYCIKEAKIGQTNSQQAERSQYGSQQTVAGKWVS